MSIMVATGKGATMGVLFKNTEAIEVMRKVDTLVVDKTGTLTEGKPKLVTAKAAPGFEEERVLQLAASLERGSEHPLAAAIVADAESRGLQLLPSEKFVSIPGRGVSGTIDRRKVALGNAALMKELGIDPKPTAAAEEHRAEGQTVMFVCVDGKEAGIVGVATRLKPRRHRRFASLTATASAS